MDQKEHLSIERDSKEMGMFRDFLMLVATGILWVCGTLGASEEDTLKWGPNKDRQLEIVLSRLSTSPKIDGVLDEDCWKEAVRIGNFAEFQPKEGTKPPVKTEVLLGYDDENLYIGFICYESDVTKIRATLTKRDELVNDDFVNFIVDTFGDLQRSYIFAVNPYGVQYDAYQTDNTDFSFDYNWESSAKILTNRWEAEIRIPFKSIRFPSKEKQHWRINFKRIRPRESQEIFFWAPISRDDPSFFTQAGHLWIKERITGSKKNVEFLPYIIASQSGCLTDSDDPFTFSSKWWWPSVGLSAKYGITSDLTLDLAINPDYSQIESDVVTIDVNTTFALFYPEKRPFFLEGKDIFDTFKIKAIHTRSINDPSFAAKLTGKVKRFSIGYITARDDHTAWIIPFEENSFPVSSNKKSFSNILRIKRDILKDSYIATTVTDRELGSSFNRVLDIDGNIRFLKKYNFYFQLLDSWTKEPDDTTLSCDFNGSTFGKHTSDFDGESFRGMAYALYVGRSARHLNFGIWHWGLSPEFRAEDGFINQNNFRRTGFWTGYMVRPNKWVVQQMEPQVYVEVIHNYDGLLKEQRLNPSIRIEFKKQTYLNMFYSFGSECFAEKRFDGVWEVWGDLNNSFSKTISGGIGLHTGKTINYADSSLGYSQSFDVRIELKPTEKLRTEIIYNHYWLWGKRGGSEIYNVFTFYNKTIYQFSRYLSIRLITQYYSCTGKIEISPLLSCELNPFTVFYFGSNHDIERFGDPYNVMGETNRQVFLKLRYLFR